MVATGKRFGVGPCAALVALQIIACAPKKGDVTASNRGSASQANGVTETTNKDSDSATKTVAVAPYYDPTTSGPFESDMVTVAGPGGINAAFDGMDVYYPTEGPSAGPFPTVTLEPGFSNTRSQVAWLATHFASHGFVVAVVTQNLKFSTEVTPWALSQLEALDALLGQAADKGSLLSQKIDPLRLGLIGYSMGGVGAATAATQTTHPLTAVVLISPYFGGLFTPKFRITAPVMYFAGKEDDIAKSDWIHSAFKETTGGDKAYYLFKDIQHGIATHELNPLTLYLKKYATAWLYYYMLHDKRYLDVLKGSMLEADRNSQKLENAELNISEDK